MGLIDIDIEGNVAIIANAALLKARILAEAQAKLEEAGEVAYEVANELVPVDTGYLKSTIYKEARLDYVTVGAYAPYSIFVEEGHHSRSGSWVPAQPFLVPGLQAGIDSIKSGLEGII
jgi:hypothetical protein